MVEDAKDAKSCIDPSSTAPAANENVAVTCAAFLCGIVVGVFTVLTILTGVG